jgi:hypothetical protein
MNKMRKSKSRRSSFRLLTSVAVLVMVAGCSTPQPARDLAAQGAVLADKAQAETDAFVSRATQAYRRREAILRELAHGQIRDVSEIELNTWIAGQAGVASDQGRIDLITNLADRSRRTREQREAAFAATAKQLEEAAGPAVKASGTNLAEARKAFLVLSQELTAEEWLKFTHSYVKQVRTDLKALERDNVAQQPATP